MINDLLLEEIKIKLNEEPFPTLEHFLKAAGKSIKDCAQDTQIKEPTLYHVWRGKKSPSRRNERVLKTYTCGLVNWDHLQD